MNYFVEPSKATSWYGGVYYFIPRLITLLFERYKCLQVEQVDYGTGYIYITKEQNFIFIASQSEKNI